MEFPLLCFGRLYRNRGVQHAVRRFKGTQTSTSCHFYWETRIVRRYERTYVHLFHDLHMLIMIMVIITFFFCCFHFYFSQVIWHTFVSGPLLHVLSIHDHNPLLTLVSLYLVLSCPILACHVSSCHVLSCTILSYLILSSSIVSYFDMTYLFMSSHIISYLTLSCPVWLQDIHSLLKLLSP